MQLEQKVELDSRYLSVSSLARTCCSPSPRSAQLTVEILPPAPPTEGFSASYEHPTQRVSRPPHSCPFEMECSPGGEPRMPVALPPPDGCFSNDAMMEPPMERSQTPSDLL